MRETVFAALCFCCGGTPGAVIEDPRHRYTRALVDAIPWPDPDRRWAGASVEGDGWTAPPVLRAQSPGFQLLEAT